MNWRTVLPLTIVLLAVAALWTRSTPVERPAMVDPAANATYGDLELDTSTGPLRLSDLRGKGVVVYFGYASCPDICPTTLATLGAAFHALAPTEQEQLALVFVSVDPERDELERLADYARYFHPNFRAGSAEPERIAEMAADWGVQYRRVDSPTSAMAYTMDHSTDAFLVDRNGQMVRRIPHGAAAEEVAGWLEGAVDGF